MVCYEILTGKFPFTTVSSNAEIREKVLAGDRPELPDQCPSELRRLIERCWSPEARARPRFADICLELESLQTSWSSVGTYAMSNSVACVHPAAAIKGGDVADRPLAVVNKQVILAENSEAEILVEVLAPVETEANSLARKLLLAQFKGELQELLISYSYVIPLKSFVIAYRRRYDKVLDVRDFGVNSLNALLQKVTDVAVLKTTTAKNFREVCLVAV